MFAPMQSFVDFRMYRDSSNGIRCSSIKSKFFAPFGVVRMAIGFLSNGNTAECVPVENGWHGTYEIGVGNFAILTRSNQIFII